MMSCTAVAEPAQSPNPNNASTNSEGAAVLVVVFGVLCLVGSIFSFTDGKWPIFMPPQLDVIAIPLSALSERVGAYVGGVVAGVIGALCVGGGIVSLLGRARP
jgi:hypothetical protein